MRLDNGVEVVIRPISPDDKPLLAEGIARLSARSARFRFLAPKNRLTSAELRYLTEIDGCDHMARLPSGGCGCARWAVPIP